MVAFQFMDLEQNCQMAEVHIYSIDCAELSSVSHCFHVNGNPTNPEVLGLAGLHQAYCNIFSHRIELYGPTNFAPVIRTAAQVSFHSHFHSSNEQVAQQMMVSNTVQAYLILLILTDGEITDVDDTIEAVLSSSFATFH